MGEELIKSEANEGFLLAKRVHDVYGTLDTNEIKQLLADKQSTMSLSEFLQHKGFLMAEEQVGVAEEFSKKKSFDSEALLCHLQGMGWKKDFHFLQLLRTLGVLDIVEAAFDDYKREEFIKSLDESK